MFHDVTPEDLTAYVDDQLDPWQKVAVEDWLARHPKEAAGVMADLRLRNELRLAVPVAQGPDDQRLARAHLRARRRQWMTRAGSVTALAASMLLAVGIVIGPFGIHEGIAASPPPTFVQGALSARDASVLRLAMVSAPEVLHVDRLELRAMTGIVVPDVPETWVVRDVQIFPSPEGPGVEMVFDTPLHGRMSMFSVRSSEEARYSGSLQRGSLGVAWFRKNDVVYILSGPGSATTLDTTARDLASTL
ncbi:anti-sigma factor family protein [Falsirhodobacter sp. 1013]|uniref:anti-sigma factor family protein n=1 Tax=Falsirhodobacter sp. 1013 TaxID=3417566 RepID=UPI003EBC5EC2